VATKRTRTQQESVGYFAKAILPSVYDPKMADGSLGPGVGLRTNVSPGFTGVALVNIINFNVVSQNLVMWCKSLLVLDSHINIY
jgi:hypothetical protein